MQSELITIGEIVSPQGITGEVRVLPQTDFPERFRSLKTASIVCPGTQRPCFTQIMGVRYHKHYVLLRLAGINCRRGAEKLRKCLVQINPSQLVVLPPGHYYHFQIIGLRVKTIEGEELGKVVDILTPGCNDVYIVQNDAGDQILIPALKKVVKKIDLDNGLMLVRLLEGLR
ncbi:MAG: 16S rRNA processing protein RimM [Firmicutes bacterium]|nr:16S rRNA processing protein RimM [Bacillota bacterium]